MRSDVKLGIVFSMVFVLVAGGYFFYREGIEEPLLVAEGPGALGAEISVSPLPSRTNEKQTRPVAKPAVARRKSVLPATNKTRQPDRNVKGEPAPKLAERKRSALERLKSGSRRATAATPDRVATSPAVQQPAVKKSLPASVPDEGSKIASGKEAESVKQPQAAMAQLGTSANEAPVTSGRQPKEFKRGTPLAATRPKDVTPQPQEAVEIHRIQSGDTLTALAERYYGSSRFTSFLIVSNPDLKDPDRLKVGEVVRIPPKPDSTAKEDNGSGASPAATGTAAAGKNTYRVKSGDSFYLIAKEVLGDANRWKEIHELNRQTVGADPTKLQVGQVLQLPPR